MPLAAILGIGFFVAVNAMIGLRLLWIARRGGAPELALGVAFLFAGAPAPVLQAIASAGLGSEALQAQAFAWGRVCMSLGIFCQVFFTWRVFRSRSAWARVWVAGIACGLVGSLLLYARAGVLGDNHYRGPLFWSEWVLHLAAIGWSAAEALAHHRKMRRRLAVGLADPVVCNRFLLWGLALAAACAALGVPALLVLLGVSRAGVAVSVAAPLGVVATACYALTFFPPRAYRAWLARRAAPAAR
jgi:hypothetical protein